MHQLDQEGKFIVNGLSDVRKGLKGEALEESATSQANQGFDVRYDRSVCPIPWWQDSLASFDEEVQTTGGDGQCITSEYDSSKDKTTLRSIQVKLQRLRRDLAEILDRPTMLDSSLGHVSSFCTYCERLLASLLMQTSHNVICTIHHATLIIM
jgi:hypothetical protein